MNIISNAYIVEWESGKYVVTHDDIRGEYDRQFLSLDGSDFVMRNWMVTLGIAPQPVPLFDTIADAESAWDVYTIIRDSYIIDLANRKIIIKNLS